MAAVIWLTGISGSGKTTLGVGLKRELGKRYNRIELLDGDSVRSFFKDGLGYTKEERIRNVKRIAFAAMLIANNGTHVIVANIAPYYEVRGFIRNHIKEYIQVYLKISIKKAIERGSKNHYAKYKNGKMQNVIGLDDVYDIPRSPDLIVDTEYETADESLKTILDYLRRRGI